MNERGIVPIILAVIVAGSVLLGLTIGGHCGHEQGSWKIKCFPDVLHCINQ